MSAKRKFDHDDDESIQREMQRTKQLRLDIPQSMQAMDVDMCDAGPVDSSPAPSVASLPQGTFLSPADYPAFNLYPLPSVSMDCDSVPEPSPGVSPITPPEMPVSKPVGIMQPAQDGASTGRQHGPGCTQIPRLRMSCSAGLYGSRSMWTHCLDCGAIQMVDS